MARATIKEEAKKENQIRKWHDWIVQKWKEETPSDKGRTMNNKKDPINLREIDLLLQVQEYAPVLH